MAIAEQDAQEGLRERTEEGHLAAGRTPPSQESSARRAGAVKKVDDDIRTYSTPITEDEKFLQGPSTDPTDFTRQDTWRVMRIMSEFIEGFDNLADVTKGVTIFGSARTHPEDPQYLAAQETARLLALEGFAVITGAGPGIMEAANRGAKMAGGRSIGCNIELPFEQGMNQWVEVAINFRYFFVRKSMFVKYAEGFVIFPGGFGTLDELFEALTLIQTGKIHNFPVILFGCAYWNPLLTWIKDTLLSEGKVSPEDLTLLVTTDSIESACEMILECYRQQCWTFQDRSAAADMGLLGEIAGE
jgi:uncharacterized protein (TIGR00730 family)